MALSAVSLVIAAATGILCHRFIFIQGEWHIQASNIALTYISVYVALIVWEVFHNGSAALPALNSSSILGGIYLGSLFSSITVYRLFLHRLHHFPGPIFARISKIWHVLHSVDSKNHILLDRLHKHYGNFVRTGPRELTVFTPDVFSVVSEGASNQFIKPELYDSGRPHWGLTMIRDPALHHHRRSIWNHAFTSSALRVYEAQIKAFASSLERHIAQHEGLAILVNEYFQWFSFDVAGQLAFSKSFNMLETGTLHPAVKKLRSGMALLGPLSSVPWLLQIGADMPATPLRSMFAWCTKHMDERMKRTVDQPDISHHLIDWSDKNSSILDDSRLLQGDAISLIIAGSDTISLNLTYIFYRLALHPEHLRKLQAELDEYRFTEASPALDQAKHLTGIINEVLRLHPAAPTGILRETPAQGAVIAGQFVPGNIVICSPRYTIGRLESCFEQAGNFIPERWYSRPEMVRERRAFAPFSLGRYNCVGKNLAYLELRIVTALLVSKYNVHFAPGENGGCVEQDTLDQFTAKPGQLKIVFTSRDRKMARASQ